MEEKEKELDCWNHSILKDHNGKLQQINFTFCLTLPENQLRTKKRKKRFCRLTRNDTFWWESFGVIIQMIALTLFRMGFFGTAHGWGRGGGGGGGAKRLALSLKFATHILQ